MFLLCVTICEQTYFWNYFFFNLENDTLKFREKGEILLMTLILEQGGGVPWFHWSWYNNRHFLRVSHLPEIYEAGVAEPRSQLDTKSYLHGQLLTDISKTFRLSLLNGRFLGDSLGYFTLFYYFTPMEQAPLATYWYQVSFLIKSDNFMNNYLMNHRITPLLVLKRKA